MDNRKKKFLAIVLVLGVIVMAFQTFRPSRDEAPLTRSPLRDEAASKDGPMNSGVDGMSPAVAAAVTPPNLPETTVVSPQEVNETTASAPTDIPRHEPGAAERSTESVDSLLVQTQAGELRTKVVKQDADMRRSVAEINALEAQARLAAAKAKAESAYIESNPERYAQQAMKGSGGFDPSTLPALNPQSALSGFGSMSQGSGGAPSLRMISGEGKDKTVVLMVDGLVQTVKVGARVGEYLVKAIDEQSVVLEKGGKRMTVGFPIPAARAMITQTSQPQTGNQPPRGGTAQRMATPGDSSNIPNVPGQTTGNAQIPW